MTKNKLKIGILGTRGIPNTYGGFEQFAEKFAVLMSKIGHEMYVYSAHHHPYQKAQYQNVFLIKCFDPESRMGTAGQFIYDLNCILDSRKRNFDIILQLGYTSSTVWWWLLPKNSLIVTNMDGLEWKRSKYNKPTQQFLKLAERLGVKHSDFLIADSEGIKQYLQQTYQAGATFIPYGAHVYQPAENAAQTLKEYNLIPFNYDLLIARFEPENNIEAALKAYATNKQHMLLLIGNYNATSFGREWYHNYSRFENIRFLGPIYEEEKLNAIRYYSRLYIHGHSVGGTNPSLLEAMACSALIVAHSNVFNRSVTGNDAFYFDDEKDLIKLLGEFSEKHKYQGWLSNNIEKIHTRYNWQIITEELEQYFLKWVQTKK